MLVKNTLSAKMLTCLPRRYRVGRFCAPGFSFSTSASVPEEKTQKLDRGDKSKEREESKFIVPHEFRHAFPDFLPLPNFEWRHPIREKVERLDMLKRRMNIDIPVFYVGSILAVTCSDAYAPKRINRFVGICIERDQRGLMHTFLLRNVIDGIAVEVPYDMYNPLIQSIQVLRLEKRPDPHLLYLRDALLEYSTFPFDMQPESLPPGTAVPVNMTKVKLKPPPWSKKWHLHEMHGIEEIWDLYHDQAYYRRKRFQKTVKDHYEKYDIVGQYRKEAPMEDQQKLYEHILEFEQQNEVSAKRSSARRVTTVSGFFKVPGTKAADSSSSNSPAKSKPKA